MSCLAIDTSTPDVVVGVDGPGRETVELRISPEPGGRPRHAAELLGAIEAAVEDGGGWDGIDSIAVGVGPGGFTGLRIGVSTARALGAARKLPIRAVSGLDALLAGVDPGRTAVAVIDARRGEVFAVTTSVTEPVVIDPQALAESLGEAEAGTLAVGDGAIRFRSLFEGAGAEVPPDSDERHRISAALLCGLAESTPDLAPAEVRPVYLRRPDAEIWLERDRPKN